MCKFLQNILIFLAVIVAMDYGLGSVLGYMNLHAKIGDNGRNRVINQEMTADIVILGSSRALHHYVPSIIEDSLGVTCYNAGTDGQGVILNYAHYLLFSKRYQPKLIIYDLMPEFDLLACDNTRFLKWSKPYYADADIKSIFKDVNNTESLKMMSRLYRVNNNVYETVHDFLYPGTHIDSNKGYTPVLKTMDINETVTARKHPEIIFDSLKITYLDSLIKLCLTRGTDFSFYVSPSLEVKSAKVFEPALKLAKKYGIAFGNHSADEPFAHSPNLFSDCSHLNKAGSEIYTKGIIRELRNRHNLK